MYPYHAAFNVRETHRADQDSPFAGTGTLRRQLVYFGNLVAECGHQLASSWSPGSHHTQSKRQSRAETKKGKTTGKLSTRSTRIPTLDIGALCQQLVCLVPSAKNWSSASSSWPPEQSDHAHSEPMGSALSCQISAHPTWRGMEIRT